MGALKKFLGKGLGSLKSIIAYLFQNNKNICSKMFYFLQNIFIEGQKSTSAFWLYKQLEQLSVEEREREREWEKERER